MVIRLRALRNHVQTTTFPVRFAAGARLLDFDFAVEPCVLTCDAGLGGQEDDIVKGLQAGCNDYISKVDQCNPHQSQRKRTQSFSSFRMEILLLDFRGSVRWIHIWMARN